MKKNKIELGKYMIFIAVLEFVLPALVLSILVVFFIIRPSQESNLNGIYKEFSYVEDIIELQMEEYTEDFMSIIYLNGDNQGSNHVSEYIELSGDINNMLEFYVMSLDGYVINCYPENNDQGLNMSKVYPIKNNQIPGEVVISSLPEGVITISIIKDDLYYVANFRMNLDTLIEDKNWWSNNVSYYLLDEKGNVLSTNSPIWLFRMPKELILYKTLKNHQDESYEQYFYKADINNKNYIVAKSSIEPLNWQMVMHMPISTFNRSTYMYFTILTISLIVMFGILFLFQIHIRRKIVTPITEMRLAFTAKHFEDMEDSPITESSIEEIEELNKGFRMLVRNLAKQKNDMDEFVYIASHDLQEPLRVMSNYINIIELEYDELLDDEGKKFLHYVVDGSSRMRSLILGLLEYSRASNVKILSEKVSLEEVYEIAVDNLSLTIEEKGAIIEKNQLPEVMGNKNALVQMFQNLIGNAIKFNKEEPKVKVLYKEGCLYFEDNGIGISDSYKDSVFKPFKRLNRTREYAGTGIGLSVVKKVVENHGWNISIQSELDVGTVFIVEMEVHDE